MSSTMALTPGSQLRGCEIRRRLRVGDMGVVFLAQDLTLGRSVAIKVMSCDFASDHGRVRRFEHEARVASALSHPNVCVRLRAGRDMPDAVSVGSGSATPPSTVALNWARGLER